MTIYSANVAIVLQKFGRYAKKIRTFFNFSFEMRYTISIVEMMIKISEEYNKEVFIGFQLPFTDPILKLKNDLLQNVYGKVISAKSLVLWERDDAYYNRGSGWAGKLYDTEQRAIYDSVASNATAHYLHILLFLLGDTLDTSSEVLTYAKNRLQRIYDDSMQHTAFTQLDNSAIINS